MSDHSILYRLYSLIGVVVLCLALGACTNVMTNPSAQNQQQRVKSSLVNYLYPYGEVPSYSSRSIPQLDVPVRVGIAFVPTGRYDQRIDEATKRRLLRQVQKEFGRIRVIETIRIIPSSFLTPRGGTRDLDRIARRFDVDLIALVSHDQVHTLASNPLSISYITIVGALVLPGNSHAVQTYVDTAVFDIKSRQLLFRASGADRVQRESSAFALQEKHRRLSQVSLVQATDSMIGHLKSELGLFRARVRAGSDEADVHYRRGFRPRPARNRQVPSYERRTDGYYD